MQPLQQSLGKAVVSLRKANLSQLIDRYGARQHFLKIFHVDKQVTYTQDENRCYFGNAPSLKEVNETYGCGTAEEWVLYQVVDFSEFCKVRSKITSQQAKQVSQLIVQEYKQLKVTEIMLFFRKFKSGAYGHFYGGVDPIFIMESLKSFAEDKGKAIYERDRAVVAEKIREERKDCISWDEYQRRKERGQSNGEG